MPNLNHTSRMKQGAYKIEVNTTSIYTELLTFENLLPVSQSRLRLYFNLGLIRVIDVCFDDSMFHFMTLS